VLTAETQFEDRIAENIELFYEEFKRDHHINVERLLSIALLSQGPLESDKPNQAQELDTQLQRVIKDCSLDSLKAMLAKTTSPEPANRIESQKTPPPSARLTPPASVKMPSQLRSPIQMREKTNLENPPPSSPQACTRASDKSEPETRQSFERAVKVRGESTYKGQSTVMRKSRKVCYNTLILADWIGFGKGEARER
jgi:hypothetical protein